MAERHLHAVDPDTGEVLCDNPACIQARIEHDELIRKYRGLLAQLGNLRSDKEAEARGDPLWPVALRLFLLWKAATGNTSKRSVLDWQRFEQIRPFLKGAEDAELSYDPGPPANPLEECAAAIIGRAAFPFTKKRENGTVKKFHEWQRIFKSQDEFADSRDRRPRDWRERLERFDPGPQQGPQPID